MTAPECAGCPMPDQVAALELVRLREGIGRLAEEFANYDGAVMTNERWGEGFLAGLSNAADHLRALLDDNQGER